jgi:hypothetical protein
VQKESNCCGLDSIAEFVSLVAVVVDVVLLQRRRHLCGMENDVEGNEGVGRVNVLHSKNLIHILFRFFMICISSCLFIFIWFLFWSLLCLSLISCHLQFHNYCYVSG